MWNDWPAGIPQYEARTKCFPAVADNSSALAYSFYHRDFRVGDFLSFDRHATAAFRAFGLRAYFFSIW